ncbi:serine/threonine-protein kinase [Streptomyces sp. VRA16 Mangrove soil]|uniref:serine/threonine-protein kinase n=1 Tax=Streptomyces sp. VRA16 Mangrove soil TaxID=2817434 RepID=UPI001A9D0A79|nr:serine/threonine-protein kinase [Streptomyces sp. VRA16 Mangrove soil]MBO1330972.1 serine/threonine protein kinase [Streptomyces sp. VRA16 Mangrove soil]
MRRSFGRYDLVRELGRGGMGVVWEAYDRAERRRLALKLLASRRPGVERTTLERRFLREARLTSRLNHPGIPTVHDHGSHEGELFLAMDLVPGHSLDAVLKHEGPLAIEDAAAVARSAAEVLAYAHGQGIVHRDLKPSNVMVTPAKHVKLLDFGVAAAMEPQPGETRFTASNGIPPGTVIYMAPEHAVGEAVPASDLYSLGCVLYELLSGDPPFTEGGHFFLYHQHANAPVPPLAGRREGIPAGLRGLVEALLEKKPENRPASAAEVAVYLTEWASRPSPPSGPAHPRLAEIDSLRRGGSPARALDEYEALAADGRTRHVDVLAARAGAALCWGDLGRTRQALDELRSVLAEQRSALGPRDTAILDTRYEIAVLLARTGERRAAAEALRRLAGDEEDVLPVGDRRRGRSDLLLGRLQRMG